MSFNASRYVKTLQRYQLMFKTSIGGTSIGAVMSVIGLAAWAVGPMPSYLPWSLVMVAWGGALGYRVVLSTVRLLEQESHLSPD
jgi:hypothetical protein